MSQIRESVNVVFDFDFDACDMKIRSSSHIN